MSDSNQHKIPQREIREPLAVIHEYAMLGAGHVKRRREEVLTAENTVIEKYANLEEQLETVRELNRRAEERCAEATERLRVAHRYLLEDANGETDESWYYEALRATDITASFPAMKQEDESA